LGAKESGKKDPPEEKNVLEVEGKNLKRKSVGGRSSQEGAITGENDKKMRPFNRAGDARYVGRGRA